MADNKETEQAEVVLGPMQLSDATAFKAAIRKAKQNPVSYGIFDDWYKKHPEEKDDRPPRYSHVEEGE